MNDDYKQLPTPEGLELCPCCGAKPELWMYIDNENDRTTKVVMCATSNSIGPQDHVLVSGCPLYMPNDDHYMPTEREAIKYWNEFSKALTSLQRKNRAVESPSRPEDR